MFTVRSSPTTLQGFNTVLIRPSNKTSQNLHQLSIPFLLTCFFFCSKMFATTQLLQKSWKFSKKTVLFKKKCINKKLQLPQSSLGVIQICSTSFLSFGKSPSSRDPNPSTPPLLQWPQRSRRKPFPSADIQGRRNRRPDGTVGPLKIDPAKVGVENLV